MEAVGMMNLVIRSAIAPVHIHAQVGRLQGVVHRGVKVLLHRRRALMSIRVKLLLPRGRRRGVHFVEIETRHLGVHIRDRLLFAHRRQAQPSPPAAEPAL